MQALTVLLDGTGAWPDLDKDGRLIHLGADAKAAIAGINHGMESGAPGVALRLDLPDGRVVVYQFSLALLLGAADAFKAHFGDPREKTPVRSELV